MDKAIKSGASKAYILDLRDEFLREYAWPMVKSGAVYEKKYLLGTSIARPIIAKYLVDIALKEGADAIAHGATGKGNDQVRFELGIKALAPQLKVIAPWREWQIKSRDDAIDYAAAHNIPVPVTKKKDYSMDRNIWHLSHEGSDLEDPSNEPKSEIYIMSQTPEAAPDKDEYLTLDFEQGVPVAVNGKKMDPVPMMELLNEIGKRNGIGIADMVENRLVGMKDRGVYETPGGTLIYYAHNELENLCLDRATYNYKEQIGIRYAELVYDGMWFSPLREALQAFVDETQKTVTGTVKMKTVQGQHHLRRFHQPVLSVQQGICDLRGRRSVQPGRCPGIHQPVRPAADGESADETREAEIMNKTKIVGRPVQQGHQCPGGRLQRLHRLRQAAVP
jgi:argininosuccinate synthase